MSGHAEDKEDSWAYWPQVTRQIQRLKTTLKNKVKRKPGGGKVYDWPYLERMKEILEHDKTIFPDHVLQVGAAGEKPIKRNRKEKVIENDLFCSNVDCTLSLSFLGRR